MHRFLPWLLLCSTIFGGEKGVVRYVVKEVVPSKSPLSKKVVFIVDISGSMDGEKLDRAVAFFYDKASADVDQFDMLVMTIGSYCERYDDWIPMPDADKLNRAKKWVK